MSMIRTASDYKWALRLLAEARSKAGWSKDPSTQVGAIAVKDKHRIISTGYNGFPERTVDDPEFYNDRDKKLRRTVHAEANVICQAAKYGIALEDSTFYSTWHPCSGCASKMINAGVAAVVIPAEAINPANWPDRWKADFQEAADMFAEAGVRVIGIVEKKDG